MAEAISELLSNGCIVDYVGRLRVVSNFGDCDCGAGKIHTRARESSRRRDAKGAPKIETTDLAQDFELSAYIPSAKL